MYVLNLSRLYVALFSHKYNSDQPVFTLWNIEACYVELEVHGPLY